MKDGIPDAADLWLADTYRLAGFERSDLGAPRHYRMQDELRAEEEYALTHPRRGPLLDRLRAEWHSDAPVLVTDDGNTFCTVEEYLQKSAPGAGAQGVAHGARRGPRKTAEGKSCA